MMKFTKEEISFILYDNANSVYATIMSVAIFPIYFTNVAQAAGESSDYWWGIGTAIATFLLAVLAPIVGRIADFQGWKRRVFGFFVVLGLVSTLSCAIFNNWQGMLIGYVLSHIGFLGSCLINDSYLIEVTTPERMDTVSSVAYGVGYIGGSTIPFIAAIALVMFGEKIGIGGTLAVKLSILITVLWWGLFSIPIFKNVPQKHGVPVPSQNFVRETFGDLILTMTRILKFKPMFVFLLAYFLYIDGVNTVINMSTAYGAALGLDASGMIIALLVTQIVAFPCAIFFGRMSQKFGALNMIIFAICVYLVICVIGFSMGMGLESGWLSIANGTTLFFVLAALVGTVQGGIQAISRSYFGKMVPPENAGEYFGFFDIFGKFAAFLGPLLYSMTKAITGRSSLSIFSIVVLFFGALVVFYAGRKYLKNNPEPIPANSNF